MAIESTKHQQLATIFRALSDPTRLRIFEELRCCPGRVEVSEEGVCHHVQGGMSVGDVCCSLNGSMSTISHHLRELRLAGLIQTEKQGRTILCTVAPDALELLEWFLTAQYGDDSCCVGTVSAESAGADAKNQ